MVFWKIKEVNLFRNYAFTPNRRRYSV